MNFMDDNHRKFYEVCIDRTNAHKDPYRKALFYTLGLTGETRRNIDSLYDFNERGINFDGLFQPWQTSTSIKVTRMAFNLYTGFTGEIDEKTKDNAELYTPDNLFCTSLMEYFFEASRLRYPEYTLEASKRATAFFDNVLREADTAHRTKKSPPYKGEDR